VASNGISSEGGMSEKGARDSRVRRGAAAARLWLSGALLPQDCLLCAAPSGARLVCAPCGKDLPAMPAACPVCAMPSPAGRTCGACVKQPPAFDATRAALPYIFPVDRLVQALKFRAHLPLAALFCERLGEVVPPDAEVDLVLPMPLSRGRLRERGFNQSAEIARRSAAALGLPFAPEGARRVRETPPQTTLAHADRLRNVRNAFEADAAVIGRRVAIVDDVMTTGASLDELARTLKRTGALSVENWVVARAFGHDVVAVTP
jgi:ComF family protein